MDGSSGRAAAGAARQVTEGGFGPGRGRRWGVRRCAEETGKPLFGKVLETADDCTLVLTSERIGNTSIEQMYALGVRPERQRVVVAKGVVSPRPAYEPIAAEIMLVNTPGVTSSDLSSFAYRRRRRPLYPFEPEAEY